MKKYIAELVGTMALVLVGCGSAVIAGQYIGVLGVALTFGFTILARVDTIGPVSGCHINPAVTLAMWMNGRIKGEDSACYVLAQCIGAIIGAAVLLIIASGLGTYSLKSGGLGLNGYGASSPAGYSMLACFLTEVVFTFLFVLVVVGATSKQAPKGFAGLAIGLALTFAHLVTIPITDTSVNPARSIGPAVVTALREWSVKPLSDLWLFILAPLVGALLAAFLWKYVLENGTIAAVPAATSPDSPEGQ
jgi:aquaporin Z